MQSVARRLAATARAHHRALCAVNGSRTGALSVVSLRPYSTGSSWPAVANATPLEADDVEAACYKRIVNKMVTLASSQNYEIDNVEEKIESVVRFLETRLRMSRMTAIRTVALHPMLANYTNEAMERKLDWLARLGLDRDVLRTIVRRHPMILGRSEQTLEDTKKWFLDQGIAPSRIPFMFSVSPYAVSFSRETLDTKVTFLRDIGLDDHQIRRVLQRFPQLMTGAVESMAVKVDAAKNLGVTDLEFAKMVTVVPEYLLLNTDQVKRKIRVLDELFGEGHGVRVWVTNPRLVMCNPEQLRRSFQYLTTVVGLTPDRLSSHVSLIMRSVDRFLRPRYEFLRKIESPELDRVRWISFTESQFIDRFPDYPAFLQYEFEA